MDPRVAMQPLSFKLIEIVSFHQYSLSPIYLLKLKHNHISLQDFSKKFKLYSNWLGSF